MLAIRLLVLAIGAVLSTSCESRSPLRRLGVRGVGTLRGHLRAAREDRGDVPGWVLITVMTAGLVTVLWQLAGPKLSDMLDSALSSVTGG